MNNNKKPKARLLIITPALFFTFPVVNIVCGITDINITEGSDSNTTIAINIDAKSAQSLKMTPHNISVFTYKPLIEQNLSVSCCDKPRRYHLLSLKNGTSFL